MIAHNRFGQTLTYGGKEGVYDLKPGLSEDAPDWLREHRGFVSDMEDGIVDAPPLRKSEPEPEPEPEPAPQPKKTRGSKRS